MNRFRTASREALGIAISAAVLGFGYTALTNQGIFADTPPQGAVPVTSVIHLPEAQALFEAGEALFIDSRHEFDYRMGHVPGALNIPLAEAEQQMSVLAEIPKNRPLVVYCDGAECNSSFALAARLRTEGFEDVRVFFGGWNEWQMQNLPSESATP